MSDQPTSRPEAKEQPMTQLKQDKAIHGATMPIGVIPNQLANPGTHRMSQDERNEPRSGDYKIHIRPEDGVLGDDQLARIRFLVGKVGAIPDSRFQVMDIEEVP